MLGFCSVLILVFEIVSHYVALAVLGNLCNPPVSVSEELVLEASAVIMLLSPAF